MQSCKKLMEEVGGMFNSSPSAILAPTHLFRENRITVFRFLLSRISVPGHHHARTRNKPGRCLRSSTAPAPLESHLPALCRRTAPSGAAPVVDDQPTTVSLVLLLRAIERVALGPVRKSRRAVDHLTGVIESAGHNPISRKKTADRPHTISFGRG